MCSSMFKEQVRQNDFDIGWAASKASEKTETTPFGSLETAPVLQFAQFNW